MTGTNLSVNSAVPKSITYTQPTTPKTDNKTADNKFQLSNTQKIIGGLSALALLGTGIYFAVRHGKVNSRGMGTVIKKDGTMERKLSNGNTVSIKDVKDAGGNLLEKHITVTDSSGKVISKRTRRSGTLEVKTEKDFNAEGLPTVTTSKSKMGNGIRTIEQRYNEKGYKLGDYDKNLLKRTMHTVNKDADGKIIKDTTNIQKRNEIGTFDTQTLSTELEKDGSVTTSKLLHSYPEKGVDIENKKFSTLHKDGSVSEQSIRNEIYDGVETNYRDGSTRDKDRNTLSEYMSETVTDANKGLKSIKSTNKEWAHDETGNLVLKTDSKHKELDKISKDGKPSTYASEDDIIHKYDRYYNDKESQYTVTKFDRDEKGIGTMAVHKEDMEGNIIAGSQKQKTGADVNTNTDFELLSK